MKTTDITITHHQRSICGTFIQPDCTGVFPAVIFSHGYNGSGHDFESISAFLEKTISLPSAMISAADLSMPEVQCRQPI